MGAIATAVAIPERDGPPISGPNHGHSPEDGSNEQKVHNLLPQNGFLDQC